MEASTLVCLLLVIFPISGHLNDVHYNTTLEFKYNALKDIMYTPLGQGPYHRYFVSTFYANSLDAKTNCEAINGRIVKLVVRSQLSHLVAELEKGHNYDGQTFHIGGVEQGGRWTFVGRYDQDLHTHWHVGRPGGLQRRSYDGDCVVTSDCTFEYSSCVSGVCKCDMEHKYDPSSATCLSQCDRYGEDFTIYDTLAIHGRNDRTLQVSGGFPECASGCLAASITTLSIDYNEARGICKCSASSPGMEGVKVGTFPGWGLAVRQCAASHQPDIQIQGEHRRQHCAALIYRHGQFKMDDLSCRERRHRYICQRHRREDGPTFTSD